MYNRRLEFLQHIIFRVGYSFNKNIVQVVQKDLHWSFLIYNIIQEWISEAIMADAIWLALKDEGR